MGSARSALFSDILQCVVEGVAHVQNASDVGRRDHDGEGLIAGGVGAGLEGAVRFPLGVDAGFGFFRVECLFHGVVPLVGGHLAFPRAEGKAVWAIAYGYFERDEGMFRRMAEKGRGETGQARARR